MECQNSLIEKNGEEGIEMAPQRVTAYDASWGYRSESENKNSTEQSSRTQTGSSLFRRKAILILIIIAVLSLITIISITIWFVFITKAETTKNEPKWDKWKQNGITVAGGKGYGQQLNQLGSPEGIFIDKNKNIFIADSLNHRIIEWKYNAKKGQVIAGGNGRGNRMDQLNGPTDAIVDQQNHSIIIADVFNERVIRWINQNQQILIHNITCNGLAVDKHGYLYVSDHNKNEVRRWKMGEYNNEGIVVAGGNGEGDQLNQLHFPSFIFVDDDQSIYVSDHNNNRVMKWRKDAKEGIVVAGGNGQGRNLNQLFLPEGIIVDDLGQIYVADQWNNRVMRWCEGKEKGEIVVGGYREENQLNGPLGLSFDDEENQLKRPMGLSFDDEGNLYVADGANRRIQKFEIIL
ncbi:unnamed protein product [Adineta steineri]|uniref:Uncharacterized protein n=1 Tax=Adineta steineri TaxID=433720 RepID=A0A813VYV7_9BILA|nr:unnamed protein product [Adineta steineri]CAF0847188.1 unnamed protein product [Adineta steineri]CAF3988467.1 unnamed protein product [Adineta steineri]CAF4190126.1 unnamed protein product [Adineta steineri]